MMTRLQQAGCYLEYLQSLRPELEDKSSIDVEWAIKRLCTFSVEEHNFPSSKDAHAPTGIWRQILSVYHNLLVRGNPTYPTLEVERFLVSSASKAIPMGEGQPECCFQFPTQWDFFCNSACRCRALLGLPLGMLSSLPIPIRNYLLPSLWLFFVYGLGLVFPTDRGPHPAGYAQSQTLLVQIHPPGRPVEKDGQSRT